jgi:hypothetical protein
LVSARLVACPSVGVAFVHFVFVGIRILTLFVRTYRQSLVYVARGDTVVGRDERGFVLSLSSEFEAHKDKKCRPGSKGEPVRDR